MDRRDHMAMSGSASYYSPRSLSGSRTQSGLLGSPGFNPLSNPNAIFQSNMGAGFAGTIGSTLPLDPSSALSSHGVNVGAQSMTPQGESLKRKRGRPRKYGPGGTVSLALSPPSSSNPGMVASIPKRGRGRPPGSGKKQQLASLGEILSGSAGMGFTPHIITIAMGEDIAKKVMAFSQQSPRALCVLSANGAVSTVTLRQPSTSGGTVTYEGRFEIICLSGSYLLTESGSRNRTGGLSVSLASPDGRVIGGGVGGMLIAAGPVQVIVGTFIWGSSKTKIKKKEATEGVTDFDHQTVDNSVAFNSMPSDQQFTQGSPMAVWPSPQPLDMPHMRNTHGDIDLMRG